MTSFFPSREKQSPQEKRASCRDLCREYLLAKRHVKGFYRLSNLFINKITSTASLSQHNSGLVKLLVHNIIILLTVGICSPSHAALTLAGKLNINEATKDELLLLPDVDRTKSAAICSYREKVGIIKNIQSLAGIKEIDGETLQQITPYLKSAGKSDLSIVDINSNSSNEIILTPNRSVEVDLLEDEHYYVALLDAIRTAEKEIVLSMFLFKTSNYPSSRANILMESLVMAAGKGVDVFVILERGADGKNSITKTNRKTSKRLIKGGVKVIFDEPKRTTHTKVVVIDRKSVFLGSHNFTSSALRHNNELSVKIRSNEFASDVLAYIEKLKSK